jgi:hypothetical protein
MFGRLLRDSRCKNSGAIGVDNAAFCAQRLAPGMLGQMDAKNGSTLSAQSELGTQLVAIYFFDYYLQNRVKTGLGDLSDPEGQKDLEMFLVGSMRRMQIHSLFGPSGLARDKGLSAWIENQMSWRGKDLDEESYRHVFGLWFLREMGDLFPEESSARIVGMTLKDAARSIWLPT